MDRNLRLPTRFRRSTAVFRLIGGIGIVLALACRSAAPEPPGIPSAPRILVLASLDGFRWDFARRGITPNLEALAARGVTTERMIPSFPSKTFPNHYTIATGLYPGHHGIIANNLRDPVLGTFSMSNRAAVGDARWWGGEPIWVTAERQGLRTAPLFWPGTEAAIGRVRPREWRRWDGGSTEIAERLRWVLERLARPPHERPRFISFYTEVVDNAAHRNPDDSPAVEAAVREADRAIGQLVEGIRALGLEDSVDLVVLADHGMARTSQDREVYLDDLVPDWATVLDVVDWNPLFAAQLKPGAEGRQDELVELLRRSPHLAAYRRSETPLDWHYRESPRVPAILALAEEGWTITTHDRPRDEWAIGGNHGYDPNLPSMGALFVAAGPSFRRGVTVPPFENVNLYELFCHILGIEPAENDGDLERVRGLLR